jgi:nitroimidazol reductase NimA-like FMN-containing flavoprotein (pyridoxamine 5'-phosphate oxidase superfamily)
MLRRDREIKDRKAIDDIIKRCRVCHLAMCDGTQPYVVPFNFGYDGQILYFHCAPEGKKIDIIKKNNRVGFVFDILHEIVTGNQACDWGAKYESVMGEGVAEIVDDPDARKVALACIMRQYGSDAIDFSEEALKKTLIFRVQVLEISGKSRK